MRSRYVSVGVWYWGWSGTRLPSALTACPTSLVIVSTGIESLASSRLHRLPWLPLDLDCRVWCPRQTEEHLSQPVFRELAQVCQWVNCLCYVYVLVVCCVSCWSCALSLGPDSEVVHRVVIQALTRGVSPPRPPLACFALPLVWQLFSITPDVLSVEDLDEIFVLVNASEAYVGPHFACSALSPSPPTSSTGA